MKIANAVRQLLKLHDVVTVFCVKANTLFTLRALVNEELDLL